MTTGAADLSTMVPGFEFLQSLMKGASAGLAGLPGVPGMGQWVAPTLDPAELDKRIQELKTVQFWLEQNARLLATTIQALEVQRMTLATLQTMNLPMTDLRDALKIRPAPPAGPAAAGPSPKPEPAPDPKSDPAAAGKAPAPAAIDPLQWWGALTQQFAALASQAVKDGGAAGAAGVRTAARPAPRKPAKTVRARSPRPAAKRAAKPRAGTE